MELQETKERREKRRRIFSFYPETGKLSRGSYPKHMAFFEAGPKFRERAMMAANRVGKTEGVGGYELTCHLTGKYPKWWIGRRFDRPIRAWASGTTNQTTKDILQAKLLGPINDIGTGLIPGDLIVGQPKKKASSVPDTIETVQVRHVSGGVSVLGFKSYEQGRKAFEGVEQDVVLLDEEPPADVYAECLVRTMTTGGMIMLTFTPLQGVSEVVLMFMPGGQVPRDFGETGRFIVSATWDDAPHLTEESKKELWAGIRPHERDARSKGIPSLGSGAIYPISEDDLLVDDFPIPDFWPRSYGFDYGWNCTAALWGARDRDHDILYLYSEYKRGHAEPETHASNIRLRGEWISGVSDPAKGTSQKDGEKLLETYQSILKGLYPADNAVEAGLFDVWLRMTSGRLKVFRSLTEWLGEFRIYRRDEKGKVVKENDHLMDCMRYRVRSGNAVEKVIPVNLYMLRNKTGQEVYNPLTFGLQGYDPLSHGLIGVN